MAKKEKQIYGFKVNVSKIGNKFEITTKCVSDYDFPETVRLVKFDEIDRDNFINVVLENTPYRLKEQKNHSNIVSLLKKYGNLLCLELVYDIDDELWVQVNVQDEVFGIDIDDATKVAVVTENEMASTFETCCSELFNRNSNHIKSALANTKQELKEEELYIKECEDVFEL